MILTLLGTPVCRFDGNTLSPPASLYRVGAGSRFSTVSAGEFRTEIPAGRTTPIPSNRWWRDSGGHRPQNPATTARSTVLEERVPVESDAINLLATKLAPIMVVGRVKSRDFR